MAVIMSKEFVVPEAPIKSTLASDMEIGESIFLNVEGTKTEFLIVHQGIPSSNYASNCDGTWIMMKDIYSKNPIDTNGANGYKFTELSIYTWLNNTFFTKLDSNVQNVVKKVNLPYATSTTSDEYYTGTKGFSAKIFLPSPKEVGYTGVGNNYGDLGSKLDYFESGNSATTGYPTRLAYYQNTVTHWWTRCRYTKTSSTYWHVSQPKGYIESSYSSSYYGIRPFMILSYDALFDLDTKEFVGVV